MGLETEGKKVMLEAFGGAAVKVDLHDASDQVLTGGGYSQQTISWTYDGTDVILEADAVGGVVAEFSVPAGTVKYVVFKKTGGTVMAKYDLGSGAETFANPGTFQLTAASLELDPS
jgi:chitinase